MNSHAETASTPIPNPRRTSLPKRRRGLFSSLRLAIVRPDGTAEEILLGQDVLNGQYLQYTVPGGCWFGATPAEGSDFALVGCTVAPGFDFADFEMADPDVLGQTFPHAAGLVREFC